ncbi:MAG: hypothetical protein ACXWV5_04480 [Flavitalea sp.]
MKNVLIPTDFSIVSLQGIEKAVSALNNQPCNIILFHAFQMPYFHNDLFARRGSLPYGDLLNDNFRNACRQIKQQFPRQIKGIHIKHLYGSTAAVFRNFVDANDIDFIFLPEAYVFTPIHKDSINPINLFKKSGTPFLKEKRAVEIEVGLAEHAMSSITEEKIAYARPREVVSSKQ